MPNTPLVCIVDDDQAVRRATQTLLRSVGYRPVAFASAEEFLSSPESAITDCLILDVQMPGMSGIDLQRLLNQQKRNVPIIFITAFPEDHLREQALAGGAVCFLAKPCDSRNIINCIKRALGLQA